MRRRVFLEAAAAVLTSIKHRHSRVTGRRKGVALHVRLALIIALRLVDEVVVVDCQRALEGEDAIRCFSCVACNWLAHAH